MFGIDFHEGPVIIALLRMLAGLIALLGIAWAVIHTARTGQAWVDYMTLKSKSHHPGAIHQTDIAALDEKRALRMWTRVPRTIVSIILWFVFLTLMAIAMTWGPRVQLDDTIEEVVREVPSVRPIEDIPPLRETVGDEIDRSDTLNEMRDQQIERLRDGE